MSDEEKRLDELHREAKEERDRREDYKDYVRKLFEEGR
jgi:hypothetical protein